MIARRPPALLNGNAYAAQKSLPGNAKSDCVGEITRPGAEKSALLGSSGKPAEAVEAAIIGGTIDHSMNEEEKKEEDRLKAAA